MHLGITRQLDVDHHFQPGDIQAARCDVGGHQHAEAAIGEQRENLVAITLFQIAMQRGGGNLLGLQLCGQFVALLAGGAEGHGRLLAEMPQQGADRFHTLARRYFVEALLDLPVVVLRLHFDPLRATQETCGKLLDGGRIGGGEQQGLAACRGLLDDVGDAVDKTHVEHTVGFVEYQGIEPIDFQRAFAQMLLHPSRRADDHVRTMLERADLRAEGHAAAEGKHLDVVGSTGQAADFLGHLIGQFACRAQHHGLAAEIARVERVQQADAEGGGLAAAGLGLGDQVAALEHQRQAGGLDGRHLGIADGGEVGLHGGRNGQAGEGSSGHGKSSGVKKQAGSVTGPLIRPLKPRYCARYGHLSCPVAGRSPLPASIAGQRTGRSPGTPPAHGRCRPARG